MGVPRGYTVKCLWEFMGGGVGPIGRKKPKNFFHFFSSIFLLQNRSTKRRSPVRNASETCRVECFTNTNCQGGIGHSLPENVPKNPEPSCLTTINEANHLFMDIGLSGPFQRLDVLGFKISLKMALQASHTVRQGNTGLLLDGFTACTDIQEFHP